MSTQDTTQAGAVANEYDIVVIGAGGAGMAAALFAAVEGQQVLLLENTEYVGGTTAFSGGTMWLPNTHHDKTVGGHDTVAEVRKYLDITVGSLSDATLRDVFFENAPKALNVLETKTSVKARPYAKHPDYESDQPGAVLRGRALEPLPFDGRLLGKSFDLVRPPIPEFTVLGGMMVDRTDINHLLAMKQSWASFKHAFKIISRFYIDKLSYKRGTRLVMGNALVASLLYSLQQRNVPILTNTQTRDIVIKDGKVTAVVIKTPQGDRTIKVRKGVVMASGGFNRHPGLRKQLLPEGETYSPGAPGHTGEALSLVLGKGAKMGDNNWQNAFWAPVSTHKRADGSLAVFPHFVLDRAKPGTVVVNQAAQRFMNESVSYHRFGAEMLRQSKDNKCIPAYLICDNAAMEKNGLGMARPRKMGIEPLIKDGYLIEAATIRDLAKQLGLDANTLDNTINEFNTMADNGVDTQFGRGQTEYQNNIGDATAGFKNPNMGPLRQGPFYAVRLYPGDIGASAGLVTDKDAQVLGADGQAVSGLYAVGNDMNSIMGGTYPGPGITLGPALAFAYVAVQHAKTQQTDTAASKAAVPAR